MITENRVRIASILISGKDIPLLANLTPGENRHSPDELSSVIISLDLFLSYGL